MTEKRDRCFMVQLL